MKQSYRLQDPVQAHKCLTNTIWPDVKVWLVSTQTPLSLSIKPVTRSAEQNARLHATLADIAKQLEWAGKKRDVETWKRLITAAWLRARGDHVELLPAIDGHGVDIVFTRTSQLTRAECAELTTYAEAWGSTMGAKWSAPDAIGQ